MGAMSATLARPRSRDWLFALHFTQNICVQLCTSLRTCVSSSDRSNVYHQRCRRTISDGEQTALLQKLASLTLHSLSRMCLEARCCPIPCPSATVHDSTACTHSYHNTTKGYVCGYRLPHLVSNMRALDSYRELVEGTCKVASMGREAHMQDAGRQKLKNWPARSAGLEWLRGCSPARSAGHGLAWRARKGGDCKIAVTVRTPLRRPTTVARC